MTNLSHTHVESGHGDGSSNSHNEFYIWLSVMVFVMLFVKLVRMRERHASRARVNGQSLVDKSNELENALVRLRRNHARKVN